jgi:ribosome biogenesis protein BMS1
MSFLQIAVVDQDCYKLLTDGTVKHFVPTTQTWKAIDKNQDNVQIVGNTPVALRRKDGTVYKLRRGTDSQWDKFGTNATKLWGWKGSFWQWQKGNAKLWYEGPETHGKWEVRDTNPLTKDLVMVQNETYQLSEDGKITKYFSPGTWTAVDSNSDAVSIATDTKVLYKLDKKSQISQLDQNQQWQRIGADLRTAEIAGGSAGLFQRHKDGRIYKYVGALSWWLVDPRTNNVGLAVAGTAYRVNDKGEIYASEMGVWKLLKEEPGIDPGKVIDPGKSSSTGVQPEEVYDGGYPNATQILLRIGNGGAGQSGLVKALSDAFIKYKVSKGSPPFKVAWYKSDTTESIKLLQSGTVDVAITYTPAAEGVAIKQGIALSSHYIFRDHFLLVGPPSNPAKLDFTSDVVTMFSALYAAAEAGKTTPPVRFLSRYDKSATNIKDSELWIKMGQVPWAIPYSPWYHQYMAYPIQALQAAASLQEYTITDFGTYLSVDKKVEDQLTIYKRGQEDEHDLLLNPAHLLIGARAQDLAFAKEFAAWATSKDGGQAVVAQFKKYGQIVYSPAP